MTLSLRADKAEKRNDELMASIQPALGDKKVLEAQLQYLREENAWLHERLTEMERATIGLQNPKVEAVVVGQSRKVEEEAPVERVNRWQAASGTVPVKQTSLSPEMLEGLRQMARREAVPPVVAQG